MKKIISLVILLIALNIFIAPSLLDKSVGFSSDTTTVIVPEKYYSEEEQLISTILSRYHYKKFKLNDSLSSVIFDRYIKSLDYNRSYFIDSDIKGFEKYRFQFDDDFKEGELDPAYEIFNMFLNRVNERIDYVDKILDKEFDYTVDEQYLINREDVDWPKTTEEANEIWRQRVKNDALNLKIAGKDQDSIKVTLMKRYENIRKAISQYKSEDVFQLAMNSYSESIDPHTNYLSPITSENFKIDMTHSLEGIGAQLQTEDEYTKVVEIVPGGPAYKSKLLNADDKIIGVAQGKDGEMVDVIGWRVTDVVQLIRGPKGSVVRLQILPASEGTNSTPKEITLVRDKVTLEEQSAKKDILEINSENIPFKIGVITIPAFYSDFEAQQKGEKDYKSTTRDVKKLLEELKKENVDGIIIDLRNNGGGALTEAINLTGLFIKDGPVVQVKNSDGSIDIGTDPDPKIIYDGPLAVLVNRSSASASEIFTGAIQDYERGIILGENTYGKGTVQNMIDLNRLKPTADDKMGQVKITIAKYYRITGGSTQHLGVVPDIQFPSAIDPKEFGESSEPSALPWDQIDATTFKYYGDIKSCLPQLTSRHKNRIKDNPEYDALLEDIEEYKSMHEKKFVSLNEEIRKKEKEEAEEKRFQRENERRSTKGLKLLQKGEIIKDEEKKPDLMLGEGANILTDYINLTLLPTKEGQSILR